MPSQILICCVCEAAGKDMTYPVPERCNACGHRRKFLPQQESPLDKNRHLCCRYFIGRGSFRRTKGEVESSASNLGDDGGE